LEDALVPLHRDLDRESLEARAEEPDGHDAGGEVLRELQSAFDREVEDRTEDEQEDHREREREHHRLALPEEVLELDDPARPTDPRVVHRAVPRAYHRGRGHRASSLLIIAR